MTPEYTNQLATQLLLSGFVSVLAIGILATFLVFLCIRRGRSFSERRSKRRDLNQIPEPLYQPSVLEHTCRWLAVKGNHIAAVQSALGLHNPTPCSWGEGISSATSRKLFVSPPIRGWILVIGQGLPDATDDVDRCFHFISRLSRVLGQVQYFSANRAVNHHAWVKAEAGQIRRAYAWAGETLWNQGEPSQAEIDLGCKCFAYCEQPAILELSSGDSHSNADKITALAARWSIDPTTVNESMLRVGLGVAGDLTRSRPN
jgi:hypothetical protein